MDFSHKLRQLRLNKGITQEEAAKAAGITRRAYIAYETEGKYPRSRERMQKLADYFGVGMNYLLTEDEEFIMDAHDKYGAKGARQAKELANNLAGLFAGGQLSEEDRDSVMRTLQKAYWLAKKDNKKYGNKKHE